MQKSFKNLTSPQQSIWTTEQYYKNTNINNVSGVFVTTVPVNLSILEKAIKLFVKNNESFITLSTRNLSQATGHLTRASVNISSTVDQKTLDKTMKNIEQASKNLKNITRNIDCATRNLSQTMKNVEGISENVDGITNSINCTMKERFGGLRLFFGKASQNCKCKNN